MYVPSLVITIDACCLVYDEGRNVGFVSAVEFIQLVALSST